MEGNPRLRLLSYAVILYMLMAFAWWSVLLFVKNKDAFEAKSEYYKLIMVAKHETKSIEDYYNSPVYTELATKYKRQEYMISGEGIVFILSLIIGIWMINRGYHKEVQLAQQKRNFLLSISHELKSPLSSIRLILETIQKRSLTQEQIYKLTSNGIHENDRLNTLVNNLLIATRMETNYIPVYENIQLNEIVVEIIEHFKIIEPDFVFNFHIDPNMKNIKAEKTGLVSVINNLVENAVKYSKLNKKIYVEIQQDQQNTIIKVLDNGIGISDQEKKIVFNRFYRIGNEDTRETKGTGLGLYIVKQIVLAHGGRVYIKDNKPTGSIFVVELPINKT